MIYGNSYIHCKLFPNTTKVWDFFGTNILLFYPVICLFLSVIHSDRLLKRITSPQAVSRALEMGRTAQMIRKHDWNIDTAVLVVWHTHRDRCSAFILTMKEQPGLSMNLIFEAKLVCLWTCMKRETGLESNLQIDHCFWRLKVAILVRLHL